MAEFAISSNIAGPAQLLIIADRDLGLVNLDDDIACRKCCSLGISISGLDIAHSRAPSRTEPPSIQPLSKIKNHMDENKY